MTTKKKAPARKAKKPAGTASQLEALGLPPEAASVLDKVRLPANYQPSEKEPFMGKKQMAYFRRKLLDWKGQILEESRETLEHLQEGGIREPDLTDRASAETDWSLELRTRDRQRKLIAKIDSALRRIEQGEYGYCEVTGEPISLARLEARPIATMTLEAQEQHEKEERTYRDD